jgi:hypothetical protein
MDISGYKSMANLFLVLFTIYYATMLRFKVKSFKNSLLDMFQPIWSSSVTLKFEGGGRGAAEPSALVYLFLVCLSPIYAVWMLGMCYGTGCFI